MQYRQVSAGLRVQRLGLPTLESFRPVDDRTKKYTDSDENPTLIELDDTCIVDIPSLLAIGAIVEVGAPGEPGEPPVDAKLAEVVDG